MSCRRHRFTQPIKMNNQHPQILTPCLISPSTITLHLPPLSPDISPLPVHDVLVARTSRAGLRRPVQKRLQQSGPVHSAAPVPPARNMSTWFRDFWWTANSFIAAASGELCRCGNCLHACDAIIILTCAHIHCNFISTIFMPVLNVLSQVHGVSQHFASWILQIRKQLWGLGLYTSPCKACFSQSERPAGF